MAYEPQLDVVCEFCSLPTLVKNLLINLLLSSEVVIRQFIDRENPISQATNIIKVKVVHVYIANQGQKSVSGHIEVERHLSNLTDNSLRQTPISRQTPL